MAETSRGSGRRLSPLFTWRSAIVESDLPATAKQVALTLSLHMNERGGSCFPALKTLASETSLGESSVKRALRLLHDSGFLIREQRATESGRSTTNLYTATVPTGGGHSERGEGATAAPLEVVQKEDVEELEAEASNSRGRASKKRARDPLFDALATATGLRLDAMTREAARQCGIATADLRRVGATPELLPAAVERYRRAYPGAAVTPMAIAKHWPAIIPPEISPPCPDCGTGGGRHADGCPRASGE